MSPRITTHPDPLHISQLARDANALMLGEIVRLGIANADRLVLADIEDLPAVQLPGDPDQNRWHDTRPCLDPREHAPQVLDMWTQALQYAGLRRLIVRHQQHPHLVRVARQGAGSS